MPISLAAADRARRQAFLDVAQCRQRHRSDIQRILQEASGRGLLDKPVTGDRIVEAIQTTYRERATVLWQSLARAVGPEIDQDMTSAELLAVFGPLFDEEFSDALELSRAKLSQFSDRSFISAVINESRRVKERTQIEAEYLIEAHRRPPESAAAAVVQPVAPRRSTMPDLSGLHRQNLLTALLAHVFNSAGPKEFKSRALYLGFVRLVDKSLEDYELSRQSFNGYVAETDRRNLSLLVRGCGHMENCVVSVQRTYRFADAMAKIAEFRSYFQSASALHPTARERVRRIRNASEHMDERVVNGNVKEGDFVNLWMGEDAIELDGQRVTYAELGDWLTELQGLAQRVARHDVPVATEEQS